MGKVNVRKRGSKWEYRFETARIDGKRKQVSKGGFRTQGDALKAGTAALNEYNNTGLHFNMSDISFSDYLDYYFDNYCKVNLQDTTIDKYEKNIRIHLKPALGMYRLNGITTAALQEFINCKYKDNYSRNTLCNLKALLTASFNFAIDNGFVQSNPASRVKLPSVRTVNNNLNTRRKVRHPLTPEQIEKIFERFPESHTSYIPLMIGYHCGLRIGETFALTWDDIDLNNGFININKQIQWLDKKWRFKNPKYDSFRKIKIDSTLIKVLKNYRKKQLENKLRYGEYYNTIYINEKKELDSSGTPINMVCRKEDGSYLQSRSQQWTNTVIHNELGIKDYDYHSLRHTHATILLEENAPIKSVQERLGHKTIKETLEIYSHATPKMEDETISILEKIM